MSDPYQKQLEEEAERQAELAGLQAETQHCANAEEWCPRCRWAVARIYELTGRGELVDSLLNE